MIEGGVYQSQLQSKKSVLHEVSSFLIFQRSSEEIQKIKKSRSSTAVLRSNINHDTISASRGSRGIAGNIQTPGYLQLSGAGLQVARLLICQIWRRWLPT